MDNLVLGDCPDDLVQFEDVVLGDLECGEESEASARVLPAADLMLGDSRLGCHGLLGQPQFPPALDEQLLELTHVSVP